MQVGGLLPKDERRSCWGSSLTRIPAREVVPSQTSAPHLGQPDQAARHITVTTLVSKEAVQTAQMDELMEKTFEGSVPAFLAAFARRQSLSAEEIAQIQRIIAKGEG